MAPFFLSLIDRRCMHHVGLCTVSHVITYYGPRHIVNVSWAFFFFFAFSPLYGAVCVFSLSLRVEKGVSRLK